MPRIIVDGMNVIGARPDGWWRDRAAAARSLARRLSAFVLATDADVTLVLDGQPTPGLAPGDHRGVEVQFGGVHVRNAADDRIVAIVSNDADPSSLTVITSDRALAARVAALGASVQGATAFRRALDAMQ
jgi:predicted RNA-binding protein with PIN domain